MVTNKLLLNALIIVLPLTLSSRTNFMHSLSGEIPRCFCTKRFLSLLEPSIVSCSSKGARLVRCSIFILRWWSSQKCQGFIYFSDGFGVFKVDQQLVLDSFVWIFLNLQCIVSHSPRALFSKKPGQTIVKAGHSSSIR